MKILELNKLSKLQIKQISDLAESCGNYEAYFEESSDSEYNCFFLCYTDDPEGAALISFLSFLSISSANSCDSSETMNLANEAEITAMTHPDFRHKGYFSSLLQHAHSELSKAGITNVYCAFKPLTSETEFLGDFSHHEYLLFIDKNSFLAVSDKGDYELPADLELTYMYSSDDEDCDNEYYDKDDADSDDLDFEDDEYEIPVTYFLTRKDSPADADYIGICHLLEEDSFTNIWGVEIIKQYRRQGLGHKFIKNILSDYFQLTSKPLVLNVSSTNIAACQLYFGCGFKIKEQIDYFKI